MKKKARKPRDTEVYTSNILDDSKYIKVDCVIYSKPKQANKEIDKLIDWLERVKKWNG